MVVVLDVQGLYVGNRIIPRLTRVIAVLAFTVSKTHASLDALMMMVWSEMISSIFLKSRAPLSSIQYRTCRLMGNPPKSPQFLKSVRKA